MIEKEKLSEISFHRVTIEQAEVLRSFGRKTFVDAFGRFNTPENMDHYLNQAFTLDHVRKQLNTPGTFFYFAFLKTSLVGYLKLNVETAQNEPFGIHTLEIERIYVAGPFQGKKIGQLLLDFALQKARDWHKRSVWLGVWDQNPRAIKFYERNEFVQFDSHEFMMGDDLQIDLLMKVALN